MKRSIKSNRNKSLDIFNQNITPIKNYMIKGDRSPEREIHSIYLRKMSSKYNPIFYNKNNIKPKIGLSPSLYNTDLSTNEKKTINTKKKEENLRKINEEENQIGSSGSEDNSYSQKINISADKKSTEFLLTLFEKGVCHEEKNDKNVELTQRQKDKFKLKDNNPYLYSFNKMHPFSMFYDTKYDQLVKKNNELKLPMPNFIKKDEWCKPMDNSFKTVFYGIDINDKTGLVISDPVVKKKFSGLIKDIIFQILKVPFGHHISLNVKIFEPKTILERYTTTFSYANIFLLPASDPNLTPYERFKYVITFQFAGMYVGCQQLKPFNPFVGETYQGEFPNGAKLYVENVTHKPLVARFLLIYKKKYEISGFWDLAVKTQSFGSEMVISQKGPIYIKFPEINECIVCHIPCAKAVNATSESGRALLYFGNQVYCDVKNKLKAVIQYNFNKKKFHEVKGCTMKYDFPKDYKYNFEKEWEYGLNLKIENDGQLKQKKTTKEKINEPNYEFLEKIKGSWLQNLIIGDKVVWDINEMVPEHIRPVKHCIPSDGRYREDLIWLYRSFYGAKNEEEDEIYRNISMEWKVMMEEFNRWERKNRVIYKEKMKEK